MTQLNAGAAAPGSINRATRATVAVLGVVFGIGGIGHGFFEALQGYKPTDGLLIHAIGEANRLWVYGNEPAFTIIPNFLVTGVAAMLVGLAVIIWSAGFLQRKDGPRTFLLLFILLFLVGGGIGQVLFFTVGWAFATCIHKPLDGWRRILPSRMRRFITQQWFCFLTLSSLLILYALVIAIAGFVPGVENPDVITAVMLASLGAGFIFLLLAFIAGLARDIESDDCHVGNRHCSPRSSRSDMALPAGCETSSRFG